MYITINKRNYIVGACSEKQDDSDIFIENYPEDFLEDLYFYKYIDGEIVKVSEEYIPPLTVEDLKSQLKQNDYKIIKCYEYNLVGLDLPYDIVELHEERQSLRDEINELETTPKIRR